MEHKQLSEYEKLQHSCAHLLAHALTELYPTITLTIGPATTKGFFYDFLLPENIKQEDLEEIEKKMKEIAERNLPITHEEISKEEAKELYKNNPFKLELINNIEDETVGLSRQGDFFDLCRGGHVDKTGKLKNFMLTGLSGAYWRADRDNQALQRISGIAFANPKEMRLYKKRVEEAKKYDHRRLGKQLDMFSFHGEGTGFPFFHPKGQAVINKLVNYMRKLQKQHGFHEIATPIILSDELWKRSGHYKHYKENMYFCDIDEKTHAIKPMNCPGGFLIYKTRPRSYRELPLRMAEFGKVHRHELSGVLHGLFRVRSFTQDDAHIYCTQEQLPEEIKHLLKMQYTMLKNLGFDTITVGVSTKPEDAMGSDELWERGTKALTDALEALDIPYVVQEGEGAFYGPKIEMGIHDSMGRIWQCGTIQVDFFQPENFDLTYIAPSGKKERPVVIHQAIYGSLERFLGVLIEHYKGKLPFALAPVQARIMPITDDQREYANSIYQKLFENGYRVELDQSHDPISGQIKAAQHAYIPWMIIVGQKEQDNNTLTLRYLNGKQEHNLSLEDLLEKANKENL